MGEKKGTTVLLTVIGLATLLVTLVGATFAFFTAQVDDRNANATNVTVTAATLGTVTFTHGDTITLNNAYPGATGSIDFTIKADDASTEPVDYEVYLVTTANSVADGRTETNNLVATLTGPNGATSNLSSTPLTIANYGVNSEVLIGSATLAAKTTDTWNLTVTLNETGAEQNDDQGRNYAATIKVVTAHKYTSNATSDGRVEYTTTQAG